MKTARFTQVVEKCGQPVVHDLWVKPDKDPVLKKAVKEHRVMTVLIYNVGSTKDRGEVGLVDAPQRVLLIFPKSLRAYEGRRIVGVDYEKLKVEPPTKAQLAKAEKQAKARAKAKEDAEAEPDRSASEALLRLYKAEEEKRQGEKDEEETQSVDEEEEQAKPEAKVKAKARAVKKAVPGAKKEKAAKTPAASAAEKRLRAQIQKAMKQLQNGKAVQAYQTLEEALV